MPRPSQISVLCEDKLHQQLIRKYLYRLGFSTHQIRFEALPAGRGAGEQFVRKRFPLLVEKLRLRTGRASTRIVVAIDADTGTVQDRLSQLTVPEELAEHVTRIIPKRNVETWILCIGGSTVDEESDYKGSPAAGEFTKELAETLFLLTRSNATIPDGWVDSLRRAIPELQKISP